MEAWGVGVGVSSTFRPKTVMLVFFPQHKIVKNWELAFPLSLTCLGLKANYLVLFTMAPFLEKQF